MKVFVVGATGVLGRRAVALLVKAGHDVSGVARSAERERLLRDLGATPVTVDVFDADAVRRAMEGHEVACNLATHIPPPMRMARNSAWVDNDRIRTEVSRHVADAALATGAARYVQESIAFLYRDAGDAWIDESSPLDPVANLRSAVVAESHAARFTEGGGAGVVLRFAAFYGPDSDVTLQMIRLAKRRIAAGAGPDNYFSSITTDDAASAVVASLGAPAGVYNVGD
jgi:nucleoside-diphosphate-sugar epimerase